MRINKLLSNKGICSRRQARDLIAEGRILVNNVLCTQGQWVEEYDDICIDGEPIVAREKVYILLHKPVGITCTLAEEVKDNIISFVNYPGYIFPVGRLDKDSQGLILMTNDGELANQILDSEHEHEKEYKVTLDHAFDDPFIASMSKGVKLGEVETRACRVERLTADTFRITLTQGLNRQIRRMSQAFGYKVVRLERIRILHLNIEGLEYGKWRKLTQEEVALLKII